MNFRSFFSLLLQLTFLLGPESEGKYAGSLAKAAFASGAEALVYGTTDGYLFHEDTETGDSVMYQGRRREKQIIVEPSQGITDKVTN